MRKEIEFVCHSTDHFRSTPLAKQVELHQALEYLMQIGLDIIPYRQEFADEEGKSISLAAIILPEPGTPEFDYTRQCVLDTASVVGVAIDCENEVREEVVQDAWEGSLPFQIATDGELV